MPCELRAPGWLRRHPAALILLILLGLALFGFSAYQLQTKGPLTKLDDQLVTQYRDAAKQIRPDLNELMTYGFFMGKENLQLLGLILGIYFVYKRFWPELAMIVVAWGGGYFIWNFLSQYFDRTRPAEQVGIEIRIPAFPSGHSMFAALAIGLLAYLVIPRMPSLFWKWVVGLAALLTILLVGYTRMFQGSHYLSDLIAGYGLALAWGPLVYALLEWMGKR